MSKATATPHVVRAADTSRHTPSRPAGRVARHGSSLLIGLMVMMMATLGTGGGVAAGAWGLDDIVDKMEALFCFGEKADAPAPVSSGSDSALTGDRSPFSGATGNKSVTVYEEYGTGGLFWSEYRPADGDDNADGQDGCLTNKFNQFAGNMMANSTFAASKSITNLTISLYTWSTDGDLLDEFNKPLLCVVDGCNGGKGLKHTLFLNYLMPIVMFGALWGAWNGLVKKRTTETAQGGLWMVGAATFALLFLANPGLVADKTNAAVAKISHTITNSVTTATSASIDKQDMCWLSTGPNKGNRMAACSMYKAMLVTPWAAGQFGVPMGVPLEGDVAVQVGNRTFKDLRVAQIEAQTVSHSELVSGTAYDTIRDNDAEVWESVRDEVEAGIGKDANRASFMIWTGDQPSERVGIAFSAVVASLALGALVILLSFSTVVLSVGMIILIMLAPIFLLVGVHPGFGRGVALKWLELLLGTATKRIMLSAMLALLVGMYQVILETKMPWLSQVAMIMAVGIGAVIFRKPMMDMLNIVNLGGTRTGLENAGDAAKKAGATGVGVATGAVAGARGGLSGVVGGAYSGGVAASRTDSPWRAAKMGGGAGRRVAQRNRAATKKAQDGKPDGRPPTSTENRREQEDARLADEMDRTHVPGDPTAPPTGTSGPVPRPHGRPGTPAGTGPTVAPPVAGVPAGQAPNPTGPSGTPRPSTGLPSQAPTGQRPSPPSKDPGLLPPRKPQPSTPTGGLGLPTASPTPHPTPPAPTTPAASTAPAQPVSANPAADADPTTTRPATEGRPIPRPQGRE